MRTVRRERGSASVEVVLVAPVLVGLLLLVVFAGRVALAHQAVAMAAADAARAASIARTATAARTAAIQTVATSLANQQLACARTDVVVDLSGFEVPVGRPADVTVRVTCQVLAADLGLPTAPSLQVQATMSSELDTLRERR